MAEGKTRRREQEEKLRQVQSLDGALHGERRSDFRYPVENAGTPPSAVYGHDLNGDYILEDYAIFVFLLFFSH